MKIKENRLLSFLIVGIVYVLATVSGVLFYAVLPFNIWLKLLLADVLSTAVVFIFSIIFKNASVYDPYWSVQPVVIVIAFALGKDLNLAHWLLLIAVCVWGIRLTVNWAYTFANLNHQDWRYTMLKEKTGVFYPLINFLGIHLFPTIVVYLCVMPAVFALNSTSPFRIGSFIGFLISILAVVLQGVSDYQMHSYRMDRKTPFIRVGLWKYSRHPNYLGEILMWWGIFISAIALVPDKFYIFTGALVNTLMFLFVSIPMADGRQSRKEGFEEYKNSTRMLFPLKK